MKPKKGKIENKRLKKSELVERILAFLEKENRQAFNYKQIAFAIGATSSHNRLDIINILDELVADDAILEVSLGRYKADTNRGTENIRLFCSAVQMARTLLL